MDRVQGPGRPLGDLVDLPAVAVGQHVSRIAARNAYRVLREDGSVAPDFRWPDPTRTDDPREVRRREGVEFDEHGRASQTQRLTAADLREQLAELGVLATPKQRAWLVRGSSVRGADQVPLWLVEGWCSLAGRLLPAIEPGITREALAAVVEDAYQHVSYTQRETKVDEFHAFLSLMQVGDSSSPPARAGCTWGR